MIVRNEDAFQGFSSTYDNIVVLGNIEERIYQETLVSRFNVVAVDS